MCLTKQETKKATAGFISIMITLFTIVGGIVWNAADANRRLLYLEDQMNKGDRFTQAEGDIHTFQITQTLNVVSKLRITLDKIHADLEQGRIFDKTHRHDDGGPFSP